MSNLIRSKSIVDRAAATGDVHTFGNPAPRSNAAQSPPPSPGHNSPRLPSAHPSGNPTVLSPPSDVSQPRTVDNASQPVLDLPASVTHEANALSQAGALFSPQNIEESLHIAGLHVGQLFGCEIEEIMVTAYDDHIQADLDETDFAAYDHETRSIALNTALMQHVIDALELDERQANQALTIVLAHELTHHVQHRTLSIGDEGPNPVVVESHATAVQRYIAEQIGALAVNDRCVDYCSSLFEDEDRLRYIQTPILMGQIIDDAAQTLGPVNAHRKVMNDFVSGALQGLLLARMKMEDG